MSKPRKYLLFINRRFVELTLLSILFWISCGPTAISPDAQGEKKRIAEITTLSDMRQEAEYIEKHFEFAYGNYLFSAGTFLLYLLVVLGLSSSNLYLAKKLPPEDR